MEPKVVETIRNRNLPDDVKNKAIDEARQIAEQELANFFDDEDIMCFAIWSETPSGDDFWNSIFEADEL